MDWIIENWPVLLAGFAVVMVVFSLIKKLVKLAMLAGIVAVIALVIWPMVSDYV